MKSKRLDRHLVVGCTIVLKKKPESISQMKFFSMMVTGILDRYCVCSTVRSVNSGLISLFDGIKTR